MSHCCCHNETIKNSYNHEHHHNNFLDQNQYIFLVVSGLLLIIGLVLDYFVQPIFFTGYFQFIYYLVVYIPVGFPVIKQSFEELKKGSFFNEFSLMSIATLGAFYIREYPEAVGVMLFYTIGELFQEVAVKKAKKNIKDLLSIRVDIATVLREEQWVKCNPKEVKVGEILQIKVGEKVPLDGELLSEKAILNASAITGESKPVSLGKGEKVLSGAINLERVIQVKATAVYENSSLSRILKMVEEATHCKAKTELLIRRLAKVYTPIVFVSAVIICLFPYVWVSNYIFSEWLYRALVFLVISCPCALVISVPLGYFGGLGSASRKGILFKGATYLDQLLDIDTLVMDKTGTLTYGVFKVKEVSISSDFSKEQVLDLLSVIETTSTHPIAKAITEFHPCENTLKTENVEEISGKGLRGIVDSKVICAGNKVLLNDYDIKVPIETDTIVETIVLIAIDGKYAGYVTIADEIKSDVKSSLQKLRKVGIENFVILSGDKNSITQKVANELGVEKAIGDLLPEDKLAELKKIQQKSQKVAFMGDGINDAPVLASAHIGIAMGAMGTDVAIETADIVIQTDEPSKVATAMAISKATKKIIIQNIILALGVKILVLVLGAMGYANLWEAVFADVGVALLAIVNAVRLQKMKFE